MTLEKLLEQLEKERIRIENTIQTVREFQRVSTDKVKRKNIIKHIRRTAKGFKYTKKNPHWTQLPENKEKLRLVLKKAATKRRIKS